MQRLSTLKPDIGKNINFLKKKKKKGSTSLADTEDDFEYEQYGDKNSGSTASGNTADDSFADRQHDPSSSNQKKPVRRGSLAGKIVSEWKKKKSTAGSTQHVDDDAGYEDPFDGGGFDDMSVNYGHDDISVDASRCDTYLEDGSAEMRAAFEEQLSPMSALRKRQKSKKNTKQVKTTIAQMTTLDEGESDDDSDDSDNTSKGDATGDSGSESGGPAVDDYDSFFKFLDQEKQEEDTKKEPEEEPTDGEPAKKVKKKKKIKRDDGSVISKKSNKKTSSDDRSVGTKKKKKKVKKKKKKADEGVDDVITTSDLLGMVSPESTDGLRSLDEVDFKSQPIPPPPVNDLYLDEEPKDKSDKSANVLAEAKARRALARLSPTPDEKGLGQGLSLDAKMGDARVDRAARRAIRRSSIGIVGGDEPPSDAQERARSRFDEITDGKAANRPRYRRKSIDVGLSVEESEELLARINNSLNKTDEKAASARTRPPPTNRPRYRRKSMDIGLSSEESEELRKRIDKSLSKALS